MAKENRGRNPGEWLRSVGRKETGRTKPAAAQKVRKSIDQLLNYRTKRLK